MGTKGKWEVLSELQEIVFNCDADSLLRKSVEFPFSEVFKCYLEMSPGCLLCVALLEQ